MIPSDNLNKIISTLEHLFPNTWEEQVVIKFSELIIHDNIPEETQLEFKLSAMRLNFSRDQLPKVEDALLNKLNIIFRWYPGYVITSLKVTVVND